MSAPLKTGVALASAARTASVNSDDISNSHYRGVIVIINVTASAATPSVVFTIAGKAPDPAASVYHAILASAAITGTGTTVLRVGPGITAAANVAAADLLPAVWRVQAVAGDADSLTYSVTYQLVP